MNLKYFSVRSHNSSIKLNLIVANKIFFYLFIFMRRYSLNLGRFCSFVIWLIFEKIQKNWTLLLDRSSFTNFNFRIKKYAELIIVILDVSIIRFGITSVVVKLILLFIPKKKFGYDGVYLRFLVISSK